MPATTVYETADGQWLALGALEPKFWQGFCERIGRPDLVPLQHAQGEERARVVNEVREAMRGRTRDEWLSAFADADVCLTTIYTPEEVAGDPHVVARGEHGPASPRLTSRCACRLAPIPTPCSRRRASTRAERARLRAKGVL